MTGPMRPLIGITGEMTAAGWGDRVREAVLLPASCAWAVQRAGCLPVVLPPVACGDPGLAGRLDGVVFCDSGAVGARRSGACPGRQAGQPDPAGDTHEVALMRAVIEARLPLLAICRGMRLLNAVRGGSVTRRCEDPLRPGGAGAASGAATGPVGYDVRLSPASRLGRLLGPQVRVPVAGVGDGGYAVGRLGAGLTAVAWDRDRAVAAVELAGHPFAIGMRWHPGQAESMRIFEELRSAASARAAAP